jgi:hypothetical protein
MHTYDYLKQLFAVNFLDGLESVVIVQDKAPITIF